MADYLSTEAVERRAYDYLAWAEDQGLIPAQQREAAMRRIDNLLARINGRAPKRGVVRNTAPASEQRRAQEVFAGLPAELQAAILEEVTHAD